MDQHFYFENKENGETLFFQQTALKMDSSVTIVGKIQKNCTSLGIQGSL
jgi:hypothetical protein